MSTPEASIIERISALNAPQEPAEPGHTDAVLGGEAEESGAVEDQPAGTEREASGTEGDADLPGESAAEEIEIGDLDDLAKHLGVDAAELYNIAVPYTQNGERQEFTLGELKDKFTAFQESESVRAEAQARADSYAAAESESRAALENYALQAASVVRAMEESMLADFGQVNWQQLQATNPAEYIRAQQALHGRQAQLQKMKADAVTYIDQQKEFIQTQQSALREQRLVREQQALLKAIPEWRDPKVADAERQELARYMVDRGYTPDEIDAVDDHRALLLVRDAMKYRQLQSSGTAAAKKVVKLAKRIVKPGTRQTNSEQSADQERGMRQALRKTGSVQDAAALIQYRMGRKK